MRQREVDLSTPTARRRLKPLKRSMPYWRFVAEGRHLGYRPHLVSVRTGTWCARLYVGNQCYTHVTLGTADDRTPADGESVFNYRQALELAHAWWSGVEESASGQIPSKPNRYSVAECLADYLDWYALHRKSLKESQYAVEAHILPALGRHQVSYLTHRQIREWHQELAKTPARLRSAPGAPPRWRETSGPDRERGPKATANRILTILKAALNLAFTEGRVPSDEAWRRVKLFKGADAARIRYLSQDQANRLLKACEADFRQLAQAGLLTGCRYGELTVLQVGDFVPDAQAIHIRESKSGKSRHVYLTEAAVSFFCSLVKGRPDSERMFLRADGLPWKDNHQDRRMRLACESARIEPAISFHILRHTYASHYLMGGGSLPALAAQLGHADTRMTLRHYGHLADSWRAEEARRYGPAFGDDEQGESIPRV